MGQRDAAGVFWLAGGGSRRRRAGTPSERVMRPAGPQGRAAKGEERSGGQEVIHDWMDQVLVRGDGSGRSGVR